jgi:hypothetical protein
VLRGIRSQSGSSCARGLRFGLRPIIKLDGSSLRSGSICLGAEGRAAHPRLWLNMLEPIFHGGNPTEIIGHVLLANGSHRNMFAITVRYRRSKNGRAQEDTFAVMPECSVSKIGEVRLALIKPIMDRKVVFGFAAKQPRRSDSVMVGMRHSQMPHTTLSPNTNSAFFSSVIVQASKSMMTAPRRTNSPASNSPMRAAAALSIS